MNNITLIIPFNNETLDICNLLNEIGNWTLYPDEIIVVNSSDKQANSEILNFNSFFATKNIIFKVINAPNSYPGRSRNTGITQSESKFVCFLDAKTIPENDWLESGINLLKSKELKLVWGKTFFQAKTRLEKNIRTSTYGLKPLNTLPGSIMRREVFNSVGLFVNDVRAGEDGDWISRIRLHNINTKPGERHVHYSGLINMSIIDLLKKWFRNYYACTKLPHVQSHKDIYFYFISLLLILIAFNWNNLSYDSTISGWNTESFLYIPNITKVSMALVFFPYFLYRAFYLPIQKGQKFSNLIYGNFAFVFLISLMLDITKSLAFLFGRLQTFLKR